MSLFSISRHLSSSTRTQNPNISLTNSAQIFWTHLQQNGFNPEKTLNSVNAKLDSSCVKQVLQTCCSMKQPPLLGLRFFIWAGTHPSYRHNSFMYNNACKLLRIYQKPSVINDVIEAYRFEKSMVNVKSFKVVLNLCKEAKLANEGLWVLKKMKEFSCRPDTTAYNIVIKLFCEKGDMDKADELMREMGLIDLYPDMITFVAMVKGFCDVGRVEDAGRLFKVLKERGCSPNAVTYSIHLDGICKFGSFERALDLLGEMEKEGGNCSPSVITYTSLMRSFCDKGRSMEALSILDRMEACGCAPNRVTVATLIKGLCREKRIEEAYKLIEKVVAGSSISYTEGYSSLVVELFRIEKFEQAEKLFRSMLASMVMPTGLASSIFLKWLCSKDRMLDAFRVNEEIEGLGFLYSIDSDIYSSLLEGLCQGRHLVEATKLAKLMVGKGIQLKAPYIDNVIEHLKNSGEMELISHITKKKQPT